MLLLLIAVIPSFIGMANSIYLLIEIILGGAFYRRRDAVSSPRQHPQRTASLFFLNNLSAASTCCINVNQTVTATIVSTQPLMRRKTRVANLALILFPIVIGAGDVVVTSRRSSTFGQPTNQNYGAVPPFQLTNQDGKPFGSSNLAGKIWIADFIYSHLSRPMPNDQHSNERNAKTARKNRRAFCFVYG